MEAAAAKSAPGLSNVELVVLALEKAWSGGVDM